MSTTHATHWRRGGGFTLMELLVVIGVIGLVATLAVPSIAAFMSGGAESQAVNYLSAICTAARTEALRAHTVHTRAGRILPAGLPDDARSGEEP